MVKLLEKLGAGQFGEVWKGLLDEGDHRGGYLVAIKTAKPGTSEAHQSAADDLMAEAVIMAQVRCSFLDSKTRQARACVVK
jgi:hypothetical protein